METLARIRVETTNKSLSMESEFADALSRFNVIYAFCRGDLSQDIYKELIHNENNMRPREITCCSR